VTVVDDQPNQDANNPHNNQELAHMIKLLKINQQIVGWLGFMPLGKLYLIPNIIADNTQDAVITAQVKSVLPGITHFLAEDIRTARRFLSSLKIYDSIEPLHFEVLDKDTDPSVVPNLLSPVSKGIDMGIISESGCPGIADPGALAVRFAHENNVQVIPLVGPSSILLALMQRKQSTPFAPWKKNQGWSIRRRFLLKLLTGVMPYSNC
jgi:hypothetical protein